MMKYKCKVVVLPRICPRLYLSTPSLHSDLLFFALYSSRIEFPEFASFLLLPHFISQRIFQVTKLSFDLITSIIVIIELLGCRGVTPPTITGIPESSFSHCFSNLGQMATGSDDRGRGFSLCQSPSAASYIDVNHPFLSMDVMLTEAKAFLSDQ